jgi:hypothetical protein
LAKQDKEHFATHYLRWVDAEQSAIGSLPSSEEYKQQQIAMIIMQSRYLFETGNPIEAQEALDDAILYALNLNLNEVVQKIGSI